MKVLNSAGLSCTSDSSSTLMVPRPSGRPAATDRRSPARARRRTRRRPAAPAPPSPAAAPPPTPSRCPRSPSARPRPSPVRWFSTVRRSLKSSSGSFRSSQYLNTSASTLCWVSFSPSTLPSASGPNEETVARSCAPSLPLRLSSSTGDAAGFQSVPVSRARSSTFGLLVPGAARPDTSPFTSETNTGTPAADSRSASSCRVLVLPVPVAPAIRPCRFSIASGRPTSGSGWLAPWCTTAPSGMVVGCPAPGNAARAASRTSGSTLEASGMGPTVLWARG